MLTRNVFLAITLSLTCEGLFLSNSKEKNEINMCKEDNKSNNTESLELPICNDDKFLQVLVNFRIANPEDLFLLAMKGYDDPKFCRELTVGTDKVTQYLKHCYTTPSQELYIKLLSGLDSLKQKLCDDPDFSVLFKQNGECYNMVRYETEPCWGPQDWIESRNNTEICNIMKKVIGCYYTKTLLNCELMAAEILNDLMKNVMNSVIDGYCSNIVQENYVRDLRSLSESSYSTPQPSTTIIICFAIVLAGVR